MTVHQQLEPGAAIPTHVPAALVRDFDFYAVEPEDGDLHRGWASLHRGPDVFFTPRNGGHWVFTRWAEIEEAYRNTDRFSSEVMALPHVDKGFRIAPAEYDPPEALDYRRVITPVFAPRTMKLSEALIRERSVSLIEGFREDGGCEFQSQFARRLPIAVFLGLMDLPLEDAAMLLPFAEDQVRNADPAAVARSAAAMRDYLVARIDERMRTPGHDIISQIIAGRMSDRAITVDEVVSLCLDLMFAGLDTVVGALGFIMRYLATQPEQQARIAAKPAIIPDAVEEMLRYHGLTNLARLIRHDCRYGDAELRAGDLVLLPTVLAGLDARRFPDPMTIDFARADKSHMIFGKGVHRCLGMHLARIELQVFLQEWFARIPTFGLAETGRPSAMSGRVNMMVELPLRW